MGGSCRGLGIEMVTAMVGVELSYVTKREIESISIEGWQISTVVM